MYQASKGLQKTGMGQGSKGGGGVKPDPFVFVCCRLKLKLLQKKDSGGNLPVDTSIQTTADFLLVEEARRNVTFSQQAALSLWVISLITG